MINYALIGRRPLLGLAALTTLLNVSATEAAALARFDFEDASGSFSNLAEDVAPQLTLSAWSDADGTLGSAAGNPGFALTARSFDNSNDYLLTLTPAAGFRLTLTGLTFDQRASATGPKDWAVLLNGLSLANGLTTTTFHTETMALSVGPESGPLTLAIRGSGASSAAGTLRLDNIALSGNLSAVPLPAAVWLLGPALAGLARAGRRRAGELVPTTA
jgi:hypothetical protein